MTEGHEAEGEQVLVLSGAFKNHALESFDRSVICGVILRWVSVLRDVHMHELRDSENFQLFNWTKTNVKNHTLIILVTRELNTIFESCLPPAPFLCVGCAYCHDPASKVSARGHRRSLSVRAYCCYGCRAYRPA